MKRKRPDPYKLQRLRQIIQIVFLILFIFFLFKSLFGRTMGSWIPLIIFSLVTLVLTLILGRIWCGWVCPLGTVLHWTRFKGSIERGERSSKAWWAVKYVFLFLILAALLFGLWQPTMDWMGTNRTTTGIIIALAVLFSVGLNYFADLFFCRYLCPLGALMTLISRLAFMRRIVRPHCNECSVCVDACPMGAIDPQRGFVNDPGACTICIDCLPPCTSSCNGFKFSPPLGGQR
jgi:polyferredoxin